MTGTVNSRILNKTTLNASGHSIVAINAILQMNLPIYTSFGTRHPVAANMNIDFGIDGGSGRHAAFADLNFGFDSAFAASRRSVAEPEGMELGVDITGEAYQRGVLQANISMGFDMMDKMRFAHLRRAPHGRTMIVEAEVRSSPIAKEQ